MRRAAQATHIGYFGKLPACADFVKAGGNGALTGLLDQWLAEVMAVLGAEPRWKLHYDALRPLHFAFIGTRSRRAIAGRLVASADQARRRYPFLAMSALEIAAPEAFVACSPLVLAPLWATLERLGGAVAAAADPAPSLQALAEAVVELDPDGAGHGAAFAAFAERQTLRGLDALLAPTGCAPPARQVMLALGLLLRPVRADAAPRLEKSLLLPLPRAPAQRYLVASFWLHLIAPFLRHADLELALFFTDPDGAAALVLGFRGADPHTLRAIIDPDAGRARHIGFEQTDWVAERVGADARLQHLAAHLAQPELSLRSAHTLFHATFT